MSLFMLNIIYYHLEASFILCEDMTFSAPVSARTQRKQLFSMFPVCIITLVTRADFSVQKYAMCMQFSATKKNSYDINTVV